MPLLSSTFCWQQIFNVSWICSTKLICETGCSWGSRAQRDVTSVPSPNPGYDLMLMWNVGWGAGGEWEDYHSISPKPVFFVLVDIYRKLAEIWVNLWHISGKHQKMLKGLEKLNRKKRKKRSINGLTSVLDNPLIWGNPLKWDSVSKLLKKQWQNYWQPV